MAMVLALACTGMLLGYVNQRWIKGVDYFDQIKLVRETRPITLGFTGQATLSSQLNAALGKPPTPPPCPCPYPCPCPCPCPYPCPCPCPCLCLRLWQEARPSQPHVNHARVEHGGRQRACEYEHGKEATRGDT